MKKIIKILLIAIFILSILMITSIIGNSVQTIFTGCILFILSGLLLN